MNSQLDTTKTSKRCQLVPKFYFFTHQVYIRQHLLHPNSAPLLIHLCCMFSVCRKPYREKSQYGSISFKATNVAFRITNRSQQHLFIFFWQYVRQP